MLYADKFPAVLPYGVTIDGKLVREFEVLKVDGVFEDIFTHQTYRSRHPQKWTGRCAAAILGTLGDHNIRAQFSSLKFEKTPSSVLALNLHDLAYVLLCGHLHTYGPLLPAVRFECRHCTYAGVIPIDIRDMKLDLDFSVPLDPTCSVDLPDGWTKTTEPGKLPSGVEGKLWNRFLFTLPTLQHAEDNEPHYNAKNLSEFNLRLAQSALQRVLSVAKTADGAYIEHAEMDKDNLAMYRRTICLDLKGLDRQALRRSFKGLNILSLTVDTSCTRCDADLALSIDIGELYPLV